jgi:protein-S-isoprenylcysteine O-methyltransferase Ste14
MESLGRLLFRWRSFTPVPLLGLAALLVWRSRGPASPLWLAGGLALCLAGQALRAWVLGLVQDGTSGQNEKLIAVALNTEGPYALTRNPLYLGNLGICIGLCLIAHDAWLLLLVGALFALQYRFIIAAEEDFLRGRFGTAYEAYSARVPRFWPRLSKMAKRPWDFRRILRKEHNPFAAWLALAVVLLWLDHREQPRPYIIALAAIAAAWLSAKAWKHHWLSGNFLKDMRRRLRETPR